MIGIEVGDDGRAARCAIRVRDLVEGDEIEVAEALDDDASAELGLEEAPLERTELAD